MVVSSNKIRRGLSLTLSSPTSQVTIASRQLCSLELWLLEGYGLIRSEKGVFIQEGIYLASSKD
jgi:hypothetical protein